MGVARLLAKAWVVFCLYAGAHAFALALGRGEVPRDALQSIGICVLLFGAMGLLFIAGFGASTGTVPSLRRLKLRRPAFHEIVFLVFVALSFANQVAFAPLAAGNSAARAVQNTMLFVVPGENALAHALDACKLGGAFGGAFAWLLAVIYVGSAVSRIGLTAGILRLERALRPSAFSPTVLAALYGVVAIVCFQLLYVGSLYAWLGCGVYGGITGSVLIGLAPLMLAYLIVAALATLRASGPEHNE